MTRPISPPLEINDHMPRSFKVAVFKGAPYYVGSQCKRGHNGVRNTKTRQCVQCQRDRDRAAHHMAKLGELGPMLLLVDPM